MGQRPRRSRATKFCGVGDCLTHSRRSSGTTLAWVGNSAAPNRSPCSTWKLVMTAAAATRALNAGEMRRAGGHLDGTSRRPSSSAGLPMSHCCGAADAAARYPPGCRRRCGLCALRASNHQRRQRQVEDQWTGVRPAAQRRQAAITSATSGQRGAIAATRSTKIALGCSKHSKATSVSTGVNGTREPSPPTGSTTNTWGIRTTDVIEGENPPCFRQCCDHGVPQLRLNVCVSTGMICALRETTPVR